MDVALQCCVRNCKCTKLDYPHKKFYSLPSEDKEPKRRDDWLEALSRNFFADKWTILKNENRMKVCSDHFVSGQKNDDPNHVDYIPSILSNMNHHNVPKNIPAEMNDLREFLCHSCNTTFEDGISFFCHIQEQCLDWYKIHKESWEEVFDALNHVHLSSENEEELTIFVPSHPQTFNNENSDSDICMSACEYFYGHNDGNEVLSNKNKKKKFHCYGCDKWLQTNIRFIAHAKHKILKYISRSEQDFNHTTCAFCFRKFGCLFDKACHVEMVHGSNIAATTCRICELYFGDEHTFLNHMEDVHCHKEMPYTCHVCNYRSSFYGDVIEHFKKSHEYSGWLQCSFCLGIRKCSKTFLTHNIKHIKHVVHCSKCRLQFLTKHELEEHKKLDHLSASLKNNLTNLHVNLYVKRPGSYNERERKTISIEDSDLWPSDDIDSISYSMNLQSIGIPESDYSGLYTCWECEGVIGTDAHDFMRHFNVVYKCKHCKYTSSCKFSTNEHIISTHGAEEGVQSNVPETEEQSFDHFEIAKKRTLEVIKEANQDLPMKSSKRKRAKKLIDSEHYFPDVYNDNDWDKLIEAEERMKLKPKQENQMKGGHYDIVVLNNMDLPHFPATSSSGGADLHETVSITPPCDVRLVEVGTNTIIIAWSHPLNVNITNYKIIFQGRKGPTSKLLPPNPTMTQLIDLNSDTEYTIWISTISNDTQSDYVEVKCRTGCVGVADTSKFIGSAMVNNTQTNSNLDVLERSIRQSNLDTPTSLFIQSMDTNILVETKTALIPQQERNVGNLSPTGDNVEQGFVDAVAHAVNQEIFGHKTTEKFSTNYDNPEQHILQISNIDMEQFHHGTITTQQSLNNLSRLLPNDIEISTIEVNDVE